MSSLFEKCQEKGWDDRRLSAEMNDFILYRRGVIEELCEQEERYTRFLNRDPSIRIKYPCRKYPSVVKKWLEGEAHPNRLNRRVLNRVLGQKLYQVYDVQLLDNGDSTVNEVFGELKLDEQEPEVLITDEAPEEPVALAAKDYKQAVGATLGDDFSGLILALYGEERDLYGADLLKAILYERADLPVWLVEAAKNMTDYNTLESMVVSVWKARDALKGD